MFTMHLETTVGWNCLICSTDHISYMNADVVSYIYQYKSSITDCKQLYTSQYWKSQLTVLFKRIKTKHLAKHFMFLKGKSKVVQQYSSSGSTQQVTTAPTDSHVWLLGNQILLLLPCLPSWPPALAVQWHQVARTTGHRRWPQTSWPI